MAVDAGLEDVRSRSSSQELEGSQCSAAFHDMLGKDVVVVHQPRAEALLP